MKKEVVLSLRGTQSYEGQEPDVIELVTEGTMEFYDGGWNISYEESDLTGLAGVTTTFRVEPGRVILDRTGNLRSRMVFEEDVKNEALYDLGFGSLLISICAKRIMVDLDENGGKLLIDYTVEVEQSMSSRNTYELIIEPIGQG